MGTSGIIAMLVAGPNACRANLFSRVELLARRTQPGRFPDQRGEDLIICPLIAMSAMVISLASQPRASSH